MARPVHVCPLCGDEVKLGDTILVVEGLYGDKQFLHLGCNYIKETIIENEDDFQRYQIPTAEEAGYFEGDYE